MKIYLLKFYIMKKIIWWTGSPVAVFENENQWQNVEIPGWFSPGDFILY